jgi:hypothetical protein
LEVEPLSDQHIKSLMRKRSHLTVIPGGFVEASGQTDASEVRYTGTYSYWQRRAREHGYRVVLALLYGATEFYWQPQTGKDWRVRLALQNIPCVMPVPRIFAKPPLIFLRELELPLDLDEAGIHALITRHHRADAQWINTTHGVRVKPLELISRRSNL